MRTEAEYRAVMALIAEGLNHSEIERRTGISRATVRGWKNGTQRLGRCTVTQEVDWQALPHGDYAYLLGLYLGDGCLSRHAREVYRLRIVLDLRYPGIIDECERAMTRVMPANRVCRVMRVGCLEVGSYSKLWPQLFPQHGPGRKHEREIRLVGWQHGIVQEHAQALLRGLIQSDGTRFTNKVRHGEKVYAYPRYNFCNASDDIRAVYTDALDRLGIAWRRMNARNISIARKDAVAALDAFVGPKR
jgi:hypothetical protein